jgi:hypothetical protein
MTVVPLLSPETSTVSLPSCSVTSACCNQQQGAPTCGPQSASATTTLSSASVSCTATAAVVPAASSMTDWMRPMPASAQRPSLGRHSTSAVSSLTSSEHQAIDSPRTCERERCRDVAVAATGRQASDMKHVRSLKLRVFPSQSRIRDVSPASEAVASADSLLMRSRHSCYAQPIMRS